MSLSVWLAAGLGVGVGVLATMVVARESVRRQLRAVRAAERRARAAERMAEIGAMTGGLAHEIKNPLSTIGLNAQLLAEAVSEADVAPEVRSRLTNRVAALRRETERLRGILADFLEFAGQLRLDLRQTDINQAVEELADFFAPEAQRHGVELVVQAGKPVVADLPDLAKSVSAGLAGGLGGLAGGRGGLGGGAAKRGLAAPVDVKLLKQTLLNLMLNAVQAMSAAGKRGTLTIRTEHVTGEHQERLVRIIVSDTGPGMDAETMGRLFVPYFTTKAGGTGLGLPTARRIVLEHGGKLDVSSEVGRGTSFVITLPGERHKQREDAAP